MSVHKARQTRIDHNEEGEVVVGGARVLECPPWRIRPPRLNVLRVVRVSSEKQMPAAENCRTDLGGGVDVKHGAAPERHPLRRPGPAHHRRRRQQPKGRQRHAR